jgi:hypothetical protein
MDQREFMIQLALADLESGKYKSIRQAAKAYNVSRSTLANRQHGKPTRSVAHEQQQQPTPAQEEFLTGWILEQDLQGYAPSHTHVREMAARILRINGDAEPLGKAWIHKYMQLNPRVKSIIGRPIRQGCRKSHSCMIRFLNYRFLHAFYDTNRGKKQKR